MGEVVQMLAVVLYKLKQVTLPLQMGYTGLKTATLIAILHFKFMQI
jgi:hypothetical protein